MITSDLQKLVGMESGSLGAEKMGTLRKISLTLIEISIYKLTSKKTKKAKPNIYKTSKG